MQRVAQIAVLSIISIIHFSCAKQNSAGPSGGPKDETAPQIVEAEPPDKTINFSASQFEISFDEYFTLDNVNQKLMISPPFDRSPIVKTKGKTMTVSFEEELRDSITYTFYFMDAVRDLNEGNAIENFQYVFSTGPTLDSLSVTGTIYDAQTLDPGAEIFVSLYANLNDTAPKSILPEYITRAGSDGKFRIDNIAEGEYAMYGLIDLNSNKIYDLPDEGFAFIDSTLNLTGANNYIADMPDSLATAADSAFYLSIPGQEYEMFYFAAEGKQQYLASTDRKEAYKIMYVFKQPVDSGQFSATFIDTLDVRYSMEITPGRDTIILWVLDSINYISPRLSVLSQYPSTDSTGVVVLISDTIDFRYTAPRAQRGRAATKKEGLAITHNASGRSGFKPGQDIHFRTETPMDEPDTSLLKLFMLADTNLIRLKYQLTPDSSSNKKVILQHAFVEDSTYHLIYDRGAFKDIFGNLNDSSGVKFKVNNSESYGTLTIRLSGYKGNIILQLFDSDERLHREDYVELYEDKEIFYPLLDKGEYSLKAIFDLNGDGEWTTGSFEEKRHAEPVSFYSGLLEIKVQWDLVQDWIIGEFNSKDESSRKVQKPSGR